MTTDVNRLRQLNEAREREIAERRDQLRAHHLAEVSVDSSAYALASLRTLVTGLLREASGRGDIAAHFETIDRGRFGGDLAIRVTELLQQKGAKDYIKHDVPWIARVMADARLSHAVERVDARGIYVNVRLRDRYLVETLGPIVSLGEAFGFGDAEKDRVVVIDYSSPNVAKQLHAGHIRSTIIGHVIGNLHRASGARVVGVNHINDFGGFGFMLEGYRRWKDAFPPEMSRNDRLLELYTIRRTLERAVAHTGAFSTIPASDRATIEERLPGVSSSEELRARYAEFVTASDLAFERLERGEALEVELWQQMVEWSLGAFQEFYDTLGIHIPFTIGESFYFEAGTEVVERALASGKAVVFTARLADAAKQDVVQQLERGDITDAQRAEAIAQIDKDTGAVVVPLPNAERLVVLRSDGRSIYATRDLGAIAVRHRLFAPSDILYVTGQEQRVHFDRVFQAARVLELVPDEVRLKHVYFGFYVDAKSKRKLSSRESTSGVMHLLDASIDHFARKYAGDAAWSQEDLDSTAHQLAVGSLVFNDLKKDMKSAVEIATEDLAATIEGFEQSGGAYVVYAACRARSILRRYTGELPSPATVPEFMLTDSEAALILQIQQVPARIAEAAAQDNPSVLLRQLLDMAGAYNSYYMQSPVLKGGDVHQHRLLLTAAIEQALENGLRICHVECPERI